jgi:N6-L-threonylcarbamoyladenine synthase
MLKFKTIDFSNLSYFFGYSNYVCFIRSFENLVGILLQSYMRLIGFDSSCDDTSIAVVDFDDCLNWTIVSDVRIGQEERSTINGGVIPEVSSRLHLQNIQKAFELATQSVDLKSIDGFCATFAPGLLSSLVVSYNFAFTASKTLLKPFIPVHHMEGHLLIAVKEWPCIAVILSGGHSMLVLCRSFGDYEILCYTEDDAVGEVLDKCARAMGLGFPGGPFVEQLALLSDKQIHLTLPCRGQMRWSFSGLKTQCLRLIGVESNANICAALQYTVGESIKEKMGMCIRKTGVRKFVLCGGVAANSYLRTTLQDFDIVYPSIKLCTDNGVMIAVAGFYHMYHKTRMVNSAYDNFSSISLAEFTEMLKKE